MAEAEAELEKVARRAGRLVLVAPEGPTVVAVAEALALATRVKVEGMVMGKAKAGVVMEVAAEEEKAAAGVAAVTMEVLVMEEEAMVVAREEA